MTEYDYSPDAYKRHLDSQEKIRQWIDETLEQSPCNPFATLPPERPDHFERSTTRTPQPAFHATPQGDMSPTYYLNSRTHKHSSQWHNPSQRSSTPSSPLIMPQARPQFARSYTTPAPLAEQFSPYPPYPTAPPSRIPSPLTRTYSSRHSSRRQPFPMPHRSSSQNSFRSVHSPHIHPNPVLQQQHGGNTYPYYPPFDQQAMLQQQQQQGGHVVVVRGRHGESFTVVSPPGQYVQVVTKKRDETQRGCANQGQVEQHFQVQPESRSKTRHSHRRR